MSTLHLARRQQFMLTTAMTFDTLIAVGVKGPWDRKRDDPAKVPKSSRHSGTVPKTVPPVPPRGA